MLIPSGFPVKLYIVKFAEMIHESQNHHPFDG